MRVSESIFDITKQDLVSYGHLSLYFNFDSDVDKCLIKYLVNHKHLSIPDWLMCLNKIDNYNGLVI